SRTSKRTERSSEPHRPVTSAEKGGRRGTDALRARRSHGRPWAQDGEHARPVARAREAAAHLYPRWIACRSRCPRRRAGPARRAPRSPQDSLLSPADWRPSRRPEAGTRRRATGRCVITHSLLVSATTPYRSLACTHRHSRVISATGRPPVSSKLPISTALNTSHGIRLPSRPAAAASRLAQGSFPPLTPLPS